MQFERDLSCLNHRIPLRLDKYPNKRPQVSSISLLQRVNVPRIIFAFHYQREPVRLNEDEARQGAGDAPVAVREWMNLREAMVQPCGRHFDWHLCVPGTQSNEFIHFRRYMFRRTVLMYRTVRTRRAVW